MSEEILKALMQLFAIIAKQDEGVESVEIDYVRNFLTQQLNAEAAREYLGLFYEHAGIEIGKETNTKDQDEPKLTSVKDSVKILGICKKINKKLTQEQKVVVLVRMWELVNVDRKFTDQRMAIINTAAEVFNISTDEFKSVEAFVINDDAKELDRPNILIINDKDKSGELHKFIRTEALDGNLFILQIKSVDLYFLRYTGKEEIFLNGLPVSSNRIYLFANGSAIRLPKGKPVYYSDVVSRFMADITSARISYNVNNVDYRFKNGALGLREINISEEHGKLIGIMGASGAGKTTLLNVLTGIEKPSKGEVLINGINLHTENHKIEGVIGYIPQDDLLIEELTVYENLYYNAKLCFKDMSEEEINQRVDKTLTSLGLFDRKHLKVGSPLNKTISGGQRKRLNIALELIREPSILFVDEPTSGLSSRDSENVMDLLRELSQKGKLIFVVIHQPSSDIYKMFDKMVILDVGGYLIYYGNPVEAVTFFKKADMQINSDVGECPTCGNVNPELIFNIIDNQVVDEFGRYSGKRKVSPEQWEAIYKSNLSHEKHVDVNEDPPKSLDIPGWFSQFKIYTIRDFISKISNKQYVILNVLEAPILGLILSFLIRYIADPNSGIYIFRENENIPPYIFMSLIVAMFLGFMVSAEEIFKDRKILKREAFLNLSRSSYLVSKVLLMLLISAIQSILFVLVANNMLGIRGLTFEYWMALFTIASFSNILGLNISSAFNSAVTIYIMIPLLMIPQMSLGGAMFSFDKLNRVIGSADKVPMVAEYIATRWAYEGLMVRQYKDNKFERNFYNFERDISIGDFKLVYYLPELTEYIDNVTQNIKSKDEKSQKEVISDLELIHNELSKEMKRVPQIQFDFIDQLTIDKFDDYVAANTSAYIEKLTEYYTQLFEKASFKKETLIEYLVENQPGVYDKERNKYHNEAVSDIVKKIYEKNKIMRFKDILVQQVDPIYLLPEPNDLVSFRAHFYAPKKHFLGFFFDTFWFNMVFIWFMTVIMYITLYFDLLKKLLNIFEK